MDVPKRSLDTTFPPLGWSLGFWIGVQYETEMLIQWAETRLLQLEIVADLRMPRHFLPKRGITLLETSYTPRVEISKSYVERSYL